jgi:hypothetical protein
MPARAWSSGQDFYPVPVTAEVAGPAAASYSTGGGGVVLEHQYGAVLLAGLLTGDPLPELGDDVTPMVVRFQASSVSAVDDLLVSGLAPDGGTRAASIGVRRAPKLIRSEANSAAGDGQSKTVRLVASYLKVIVGAWEEIRAGQRRLVLAAVASNSAVRQAGELAGIARAAGSEAAFRAELAHGPHEQVLRDRLGHLDDLVAAALRDGPGAGGLAAAELTWRWLFSLRVRELRLEGADTTDRTFTVARLRGVVAGGTAAAADALFGRLAVLASRYAPAAAIVDEATLRRDLSGTRLTRSPQYPRAWNVLDRLAAQLAASNRFMLDDGSSELRLERQEARQAMLLGLRAAAAAPAGLVITGEPDTGKSALALSAADDLAEAGTPVSRLNLRDLPATLVELEGLLDAPLADVLAGTATGDGRLLLIDGAEAALEGRDNLLNAVATAALRAGLGVAAVTRADGAMVVSRTLTDATRTAELTAAVAEHVVGRLTPGEISQIAAAFPALARLAAEPRAVWLLGRPGLVDLLLRGGAAGSLPEGPLCEADVFAAIWHQLVRHAEVREPGGPSPDAREQALVALARRRLLPGEPGDPPDLTSLPSLRSDGLLRPAGATSAWNPDEEFASDLVADLAVARLLITGGWQLLSRGGAPRWALRAARLACQAKIVGAGDGSEQARSGLNATFDEIAEQAGQRWAEIPDEALLTIGAGRQAMARAWPALLAADCAGLMTILRLAQQRYVTGGIGDVTVLEPLVELAYCGDENLGQDDWWDRNGTGGQIRGLVQPWLRGMIAAGSGPDALRQRVRDRILARSPEPHDEFAVEALATLGPDLDDRAEAFLRAVPGGHLEPAVERIGPTSALVAYQPGLLSALAESYYLMAPGEQAGTLDFLGGIRSHRPAGGMMLAAWWYGPFFLLLWARPADGLALINLLLDHAAAIRAGAVPPPGADTPGLDLDLPGAGTRRCAGDGDTWRWYRGGAIAPYPCLSALLAVERWADHLIDVLQVPISDVIEFLLRDCHNLAMPGLVVGLLVRHPELAGGQLDPWLTRPELWRLEADRAAGEGPGTLHVQGPDPADLHGRERRGLSFSDVAAGVTVQAGLDGDHERLAALAAIGDELVRRAADLTAGREDAEKQVAAARRWAAILDPENHHLVPTEDDSIRFEFQAPDDVAQTLAGSHESLERSMTMLRLQSTYTSPTVWDAPVGNLTADLAAARQLAADTPAGPVHPADPIAAVAAAAVAAHARGRAVVPEEDLRWAADVLVEVAAHPWTEAGSIAESRHRIGADRSAAAALPALLLPEFDDIRPGMSAPEEALQRLGTGVPDETRMIFARASAPVWAAPCDTSEGRCRHQVLWQAVLGGVRDCQLGAWDPASQRRLIEPLTEPYDQALPLVHTERLLVNRLTGPLVGAAQAASSGSCVAQEANQILDILLTAHRRGAAHWAEKNYGAPGGDEHGPAIARTLAEMAAAGNAQPLAEHVRAFTRQSPRALAQLLHDLAIQFTYDDALRQTLPAAWRPVMEAALAEMETDPDLPADRHWPPIALAGLIPAPEPALDDTDPDASLDHARETWPAPETFSELIKRWLPIARGQPQAADALIKLARCAPPAWQATTGLQWVEELISGNFSAVAGRSYYLTRWLADIQTALPGEADSARWRRIVDGLAAGGDNPAARLQQAEE